MGGFLQTPVPAILTLTLVFLVYCGATYSNKISMAYMYDIFMKFFVICREIREINKWGLGGGGQNKLGGCKNHKKINVHPV